MARLLLPVLLLAILTAVCGLPEVKFFSFNPTQEIKYDGSPLSTASLKIDPSLGNLKILCHGWQSDIESPWYEPTADRYIQTGQLNVIAIDWSHYAKRLYPDAVDNVYKVGEYVGEIVLDIQRGTSVPLEQIHLLGHSLGAQVMGRVGQYVFKKSGQKIGRITGLDPAGPSFDSNDIDKRLSFDDATFVDVIHTNTIFLGYKTSLGHVDFWPNSGRDQSGCNGDLSCSHNLAPIFFSETINSTSFPAWYCDSYESFKEGECFDNPMIYMGDGAPANMRGDFFLDTNTESPYGKGLMGH